MCHHDAELDPGPAAQGPRGCRDQILAADRRRRDAPRRGRWS